MEPPTAPRRVVLDRSHLDVMRAHVAACAPEEACGLLAGRDGRCVDVLPLTNVLHSPTRYRVAPEELFEAFMALERNGRELLGIFHSHPAGVAYPSATDVAEAYYPSCAYFIWALRDGEWACRAFRIVAGEIAEISVGVE